MRVKISMKANCQEWEMNLLLREFNGHADDKKAVRNAVMAELDGKGMSHVKGYVQGIEQIRRTPQR